MYERLKYDRLIQAHSLKQAPIFVLGHWRSGTSYLQELLGLDPALSTCSLFECLFADCMFSTRTWLPGLIDSCSSYFDIRYRIQERPLRSHLPAEEEIGMLCMSQPESTNWGQIFPRQMLEYIDGSSGSRKPDLTTWLSGYQYFVNKLSMAHPRRRLVLKSPMNTSRVPELLTVYPGAKFIFIHRHPLQVFDSCRRLWKLIRRQSSLQTISDDDVDRLIEKLYERVMLKYIRDRQLISANCLVEVPYEDLRADPVVEVTAIYAALGLGDVPSAQIRAFIDDVAAPCRKPLSIDRDLEVRIRSTWHFAFREWRYD